MIAVDDMQKPLEKMKLNIKINILIGNDAMKKIFLSKKFSHNLERKIR